MKTETEIKTPLGYRFAVPGDKRCKGMKLWCPVTMEWLLAEDGPEYLLNCFVYAIPLDDGYEYFEPETTKMQSGDEGQAYDGWRKLGYTSFGNTNYAPIRRPKVKPDPIAKGRNLADLTESQVSVSDGWRLIEDSEIYTIDRDGLEFWCVEDDCWHPSIVHPTHRPFDLTYRTKSALVTGLPDLEEQEEKTYTTVRINNGVYNIPNRFAPIIKGLLQEIGGLE